MAAQGFFDAQGLVLAAQGLVLAAQGLALDAQGLAFSVVVVLLAGGLAAQGLLQPTAKPILRVLAIAKWVRYWSFMSGSSKAVTRWSNSKEYARYCRVHLSPKFGLFKMLNKSNSSFAEYLR